MTRNFLNYTSISLFLFIITTPVKVFSQEFPSSPRIDENSITAHEELLQKAQQGVIDIFFEGDSITRRWGTTDTAYQAEMDNWVNNFHGWNAANFAWGGDTVQNILWSLEDGELDGPQPEVFVLLAGTNNLSEFMPAEQENAKVDEIVTGIKAIMDFMHSKVPEATIILTGILPRNGRGSSTALIPLINRINGELETLANGDSIRYININDGLADENGVVYEGMFSDGLHLAAPGYQVWADKLKPIFTEILGPPAEEDFAPPPTGNPAAR